MGPRRGCLTQDRSPRFLGAWRFGPSDDAAAPAAVVQTRARTAGQSGVPRRRWGRAVSREAVPPVDRDPVRTGRRRRPRRRPPPGTGWVQAVTHRRGRRRARGAVRIGRGEALACPYTGPIERRNGVLRDRLACLTRTTHAVAQATVTWDAAGTLAMMEHNWPRPHTALRQRVPLPVGPSAPRSHRRPPALAISLTDHTSTWAAFLTRPLYPHGRE